MLLKYKTMSSFTLRSSYKIENKEVETIYKELQELARLVVEDTVDKLIEYFLSKKVDLFEEKIKKAKNYKNGYILKLFLEKLDKVVWDKEDEILSWMLQFVKSLA